MSGAESRRSSDLGNALSRVSSDSVELNRRSSDSDGNRRQMLAPDDPIDDRSHSSLIIPACVHSRDLAASIFDSVLLYASSLLLVYLGELGHRSTATPKLR
ncbi:unnamed protein product [Nippostrongylus brasiliensis]|uniref:Ion_trans_2 domain-containing protein n=1 Tax=Nippostrongylus brasiliensis TaxID=27835 RepID=A0A0N4YM78_NIPBR|nr:unnamed protein product [Nippostrongylus brasiliensis]